MFKFKTNSFTFCNSRLAEGEPKAKLRHQTEEKRKPNVGKVHKKRRKKPNAEIDVEPCDKVYPVLRDEDNICFFMCEVTLKIAHIYVPLLSLQNKFQSSSSPEANWAAELPRDPDQDLSNGRNGISDHEL